MSQNDSNSPQTNTTFFKNSNFGSRFAEVLSTENGGLEYFCGERSM